MSPSKQVHDKNSSLLILAAPMMTTKSTYHAIRDFSRQYIERYRAHAHVSRQSR